MNAIISLCHFCEVHGPSILFCTQAFHSPDPQQVLQEESGDLDAQDSFGVDPNSSTGYYVRDRERLLRSPLGAAARVTETMSAPVTPTSPTSLTTPTATKVSEFCEACRSIQSGQSGFISNDHEAKVSYVSNQHPDHPEVFSMVRQACVRSLSCEVCPGREGPIFFGDNHRGHVLSYTFFLKDSQARGFQRSYSILVVMMDKIFLLNSWPFLVKHIQSIIDELKGKALKVYEEEQARCPQRAQRLNNLGRMTPQNFRLHRGGNPRSLCEITVDKAIFRKLHQAFTWLLKAGGNRLTERLLEGPPTEDSVIDLEKQEETEEGFVKLFSKKLEVDEGGTGQESVPITPEEETPETPIDTPTFRNLRHLQKVLGNTKFRTLAHHVVIGNQIIIKCKRKRVTKSVIDCLRNLLPKGCCKVIYASTIYEDSWRCNFLGLSPETELPSHTFLYVVLDIVEPEATPGEYRPPDCSDFDGWSMTLTSPIQLPDKVPTVLSKMETALLNGNLADSVVEQCLICLREEWMNKVKVLFKFTKAGGSRSEEDTRRLLQVVRAQQEDQSVLKFWMTGLSVQYRNHTLSSAVHKAGSK